MHLGNALAIEISECTLRLATAVDLLWTRLELKFQTANQLKRKLENRITDRRHTSLKLWVVAGDEGKSSFGWKQRMKIESPDKSG